MRPSSEGSGSTSRRGLCRWNSRRRTRSGLNGLPGQRDHADRLAHGHGLAGLGDDLAQDAGRRRDHFDGRLVGLNYEERLLLLDGVAWLLEPLGDGALFHRQAEYGHGHLVRHQRIPS